MRKLITALLCVFFTLVVGCSAPTSIVKNTLASKPSVIKSRDNVFQVTVPSGWIITSKGELNDLACLEVANKLESKYLMVIADNKKDLQLDLKGYNDLVVQNLQTSYNTTLEPSTQTKVGKYNAYTNDFTTIKDSMKFHMFVYNIETENYYAELYFWTTESKSETIKTELTSIVNSFAENVAQK